MITRRGLLGGVGALLCAPAIIRSSGVLMPVKPFKPVLYTVRVAPSSFNSRIAYMGLAQLKVEGGATTFDNGVWGAGNWGAPLCEYVATEQIAVGSPVCIGTDGYARAISGESFVGSVVGIAV